MIEDIVEVQALSSLRRFYTDDAGYALAKRVDIDLVQLGRGVNGATIGTNDYATAAASTNAFIGSTGATVYNSSTSNAAALGDSGIRRSIQRLDDQDVPMTDRFLIVPPSSRNTLMSISRFTEQAFVGEQGGNNTIRNGQIYKYIDPSRFNKGRGLTKKDQDNIIQHVENKDWMKYST